MPGDMCHGGLEGPEFGEEALWTRNQKATVFSLFKLLLQNTTDRVA